MKHRSFGRRGEPQRQLSPSVGAIEAVAQSTRIDSTDRSVVRRVLLSEQPEFSSLDDDLREWKLARKQNFEVPWRPLSLLAVLFFGIASFALPDSVNDIVQWPLYALAAASFYVGFRRRRKPRCELS
ncbi:MAG TPA: hypothetical protein VEK74_07885 [Burkholderiaceae bacterium]|nr:hypothetical protein [Burkholderiaceae bacterium]